MIEDKNKIDNSDIIDIFGAKDLKKENIIKSSPEGEGEKDKINNTPAVPDEQLIEKPDFKKEDNISELIILVNEISGILKSELKKFVSEKLIDNMLLRSLEKMAIQSFLFKNSNWNAEGNLRTDGSIDVERVIKNYMSYKNEPEKIEEELITYLCILFSYRIKAIKAVFDKDKYDSFITGFINKKNVVEQGYKKPITNFFNDKIFQKVLKGDE